jgi:hypothetical protein
MVDSADLGFYGAAWRFTDFCQHLYARSVYLQLVLKSGELPGLFRSSPRSATRLADVCSFAITSLEWDLCQELFLADGARSDQEDAVLQNLRNLLE